MMLSIQQDDGPHHRIYVLKHVDKVKNPCHAGADISQTDSSIHRFTARESIHTADLFIGLFEFWNLKVHRRNIEQFR